MQTTTIAQMINPNNPIIDEIIARENIAQHRKNILDNFKLHSTESPFPVTYYAMVAEIPIEEDINPNHEFEIQALDEWTEEYTQLAGDLQICPSHQITIQSMEGLNQCLAHLAQHLIKRETRCHYNDGDEAVDTIHLLVEAMNDLVTYESLTVFSL